MLSAPFEVGSRSSVGDPAEIVPPVAAIAGTMPRVDRFDIDGLSTSRTMEVFDVHQDPEGRGGVRRTGRQSLGGAHRDVHERFSSSVELVLPGPDPFPEFLN